MQQTVGQASVRQPDTVEVAVPEVLFSEVQAVWESLSGEVGKEFFVGIAGLSPQRAVVSAQRTIARRGTGEGRGRATPPSRSSPFNVSRRWGPGS